MNSRLDKEPQDDGKEPFSLLLSSLKYLICNQDLLLLVATYTIVIHNATTSGSIDYKTKHQSQPSILRSGAYIDEVAPYLRQAPLNSVSAQGHKRQLHQHAKCQEVSRLKYLNF